MSESERATEYRRMMKAREDNALALEKALAGDPEAYNALLAKTVAITDRNMRMSWDPVRKVKDDAE